MFESRVLRWIFGPKRDKVTGEWIRLHKEELYSVLLTSIIQLIKSEEDIWA
jgi:hypothetical protein